MGPIPYGEVFGELFGFATVKEFLAYMDGYSLDASVKAAADSASFKAPLYVFDGELIQNHFIGKYNIKGMLMPFPPPPPPPPPPQKASIYIGGETPSLQQLIHVL